MPDEKPTAQERLLWVVLACLAWKYATTMEAMGVGRDSLVAIMAFVGTWGLGLAALVVGLTDRFHKHLRGWPIFGFFSFVFFAYAAVNTIYRARDPYTFTTDAHTFMDYAARLLLEGKNPYDWPLSGAFTVHHMPSDLQTPLESGGLSDRLAYPSLSVLYLVPFVAVGIPTLYAYAAALYGCLVVAFKAAPPALRPLVLLPLFADQSFVAFAFGGLTDTVWALLFCLAVLYWSKKPVLAAVLVGLACAYKQHACLLTPFLLVRLARETPPEERKRVLLRFIGIVGGVFVLLNLPFVLWSPREWLLAFTEPLVAEMVPLGEGPSAFVTVGGVAAPKMAFTAVFWSTYLLLLYVTATWSRGAQLAWMAPSIAFFLNYRSLSSYWYFNLLPFLVDLAMTPVPAEPSEPLSARARKIALAYAGVVVAAFSTVVWYNHSRHGAVDIEILDPMRTFAAKTHRIDLRIHNRGKHPVHVRFWVQGENFQPLPWRMDAGPHTVQPGTSADYSISAMMRSSAFDMFKGATLTVDDPNTGFRKSIVIPPDDAWGSPRAIPNAKMRFWDVRTGSPSFWSLAQKGSPGAYAMPLLREKGETHAGVLLGLDSDENRGAKDQLQFCLAVTSCWSGASAALRYAHSDTESDEHMVSIVTELANRTGQVSVWAKPPADANKPPFHERYGVRITIADTEVMLLLGGEAAEGKLENGLPFEVIPGARDAWGRYTIDFDRIQKRYAPTAYPRWYELYRFPLLDIPVLPMRVALEYVSHAKGPRTAVFGTVEDAIVGKERPADVYALVQAHPAEVDAFRADYELQLGNPTRASRYLDRGIKRESHPALDLAAARLAAYHQEHEKAKALYTKLEPIKPVQANIALGWLAMQARDPATAATRFERALAEIAKVEEERKKLSGTDELDRDSAYMGVAIARADLGDCAASKRALKELPEKEREDKSERILSIKTCLQRPE